MRTTAREVKLLKKCLKGNSQAFEGIVAKYQVLICAITFSGVTDVQQSEELAHQTFINAWNKLSQLRDLSRFRPWLCTIARNNIRNFLNKSQRDIIAKAKSMENINDTAADEAGPLESAIKKEHEELVSDAIRRIPEQYREPLVLYYRQQQSVKQVAQSLDLSQDVVKQRLQRGRKMIKEQLSSIVEETLSATGPKKAFTTAVIASIAGMAIKGSGVATAAGIATASFTTGIATAVAVVMSGVTAKIITAAAVVVIGVGAVVTYKHITKPIPEPEFSQAGMVAQEQGDGRDKITEEVIEQPSDKAANLLAIDEAQSGLETGESLVASPDPASTKDVEFSFAPKGVLSGLITDVNTGEPVSDARVRISIRSMYTTETDANGFYYFDKIKQDGNYRIQIASKEYVGIYDYEKQPLVSLKKDKQRVKHFELEKACMIEVRVVDEAGEPVKKARVIATSLADNRRREIGHMLHFQGTDDDGFIMLGGFKPSATNYLITAMHKVEKEHIDKGDGLREVIMGTVHAPGKLFVKLNDPEVIQYGEIVLEKGVKVTGYAQYADGIPADGLKVSAKPDWWHCNSSTGNYPVEPNGFFTLENIVPGDFSIHAYFEHEDGEGGYSFAVMQSKLPIEDDGLLIVKIPKKSPGSLVSISGTIKFTGDKRPDYIDISAYSPTGSREHVSLRKDMDSFTVRSLEPGVYRLSFSGSNIKRKVVENVEAPNEGLEVELEYLEKPRIGGTVVDGLTGDAVKIFRARARKVQTLHGNNYVQGNQWNEVDNTEGKYEIQTVGPGVYQVQVAAEGYAWLWSEEINTDDNKPVVISLTAGGNIKGMVVDDKGKPVTDAKVVPLSKASGNMPRTNETFTSDDGAVETVNGEFLLENLAAGKETLKVMCDGYSFSIVKAIEVVEGETTEGVQIVLTKGGTVEGYVYDRQGKAQGNVVLYFQDDSGYGGSGDEEAGRLAIAITDPNGFYHVSGLPEKICYVRRQNSGKNLGVVRRAILPENSRVFRLDFGGGPVVSGQLIVDGAPLVNRKLLLGSPLNPRFGYFKCYDWTDADGGFNFSGVPVGKFAIYYEQADKRREWIKFGIVDVKGEDIDLGAVPDQMAKVIVTIEMADAESNMQISLVMIQEGTDLLGRQIGVAKAPVSQGQSYVINSVPAGKHTLSIIRNDFFTIRKEIEIEEAVTEAKVLFMMPKSTASVSGKITGNNRVVSFWSSDEKLTGMIRAGDDGSFMVGNLPAGKYLAGFNMQSMKKVIAEFELSEGQEKIIELDTSGLQTSKRSVLHVQIVDDNGIPFGSAEVWLESDGQEIEPYMNSDYGIFFAGAQGEYILHAVYPGYKETTKKVWLEPDDITSIRNEETTVVIRLEKVQ